MADIDNSDFFDQINERRNNLGYSERLAGKGLMMPSNTTTSGPRKILHSTQFDHHLGPYEPKIPRLGTGFEAQFGEYSSSFKKADVDYKVIAKIPKFSFMPDYHYWLILFNTQTGEYTVEERKVCEHITETYGFLYNNSYIDSLKQGDTIPAGNVLKKSNGFDENNNRMDGRDLVAAYVSTERTKEDAFEISDYAAEVLAAPLVKHVSVVVNDNDIPLNFYGTIGPNSVYKIHPDIFEEIKNGIIMGLRREKKEEALYAQSGQSLQTLLMSDDTYTSSGKIVDIDIYCNNEELLETNPYYAQFAYYYNDKKKCMQYFISVVENIISTGKCSWELQKMYSNYKDILNGKEYLKDKPFSNIIIEFTILDKNPVKEGDKLSNRYGGKGVVSRITPRKDMSKIVIGGVEKTVDIYINAGTCINRENPGQLMEMSQNFINAHITEYISMNVLDLYQKMDLIENYLRVVAPTQADALCETFNSCGDEIKKMFIDSIIEEGGIYVSQLPLTEAMSLDKIALLYDIFPWITQATMLVPQEGSDDSIRFIPAIRKMVAAEQYFYRLKQYGEEKFSAVSLASTNIKNEPTRSNSKKSHKSMHSKNPVKFFGEMETNDLQHLGAEYVVQALMMYSTSPHARKLCESLLVGDPYDIDIKLDDKSTNRSVEIVNAYLKVMGLKIEFTKVPINLKPIMMRQVMTRVPEFNQKIFTRVECDQAYPKAMMERALYDFEKNGPIKQVIMQKRIMDKL